MTSESGGSKWRPAPRPFGPIPTTVVVLLILFGGAWVYAGYELDAMKSAAEIQGLQRLLKSRVDAMPTKCSAFEPACKATEQKTLMQELIRSEGWTAEAVDTPNRLSLILPSFRAPKTRNSLVVEGT